MIKLDALIEKNIRQDSNKYRLLGKTRPELCARCILQRVSAHARFEDRFLNRSEPHLPRERNKLRRPAMACGRCNRQAFAHHRSRIPTHPAGNKTGLSLGAAANPFCRLGKNVPDYYNPLSKVGKRMLPRFFCARSKSARALETGTIGIKTRLPGSLKSTSNPCLQACCETRKQRQQIVSCRGALIHPQMRPAPRA